MNKNLNTLYTYAVEQICMIVTSLETSFINDSIHSCKCEQQLKNVTTTK